MGPPQVIDFNVVGGRERDRTMTLPAKQSKKYHAVDSSSL